MPRICVACLLLLLAGCGTPSFLVTPVANNNQLEETTVQPGSWLGGKIVIIPVEGMLLDNRSGGLLQPTENPLSLFTQELDRAADDPTVKAVVLRINSPGGSVTTSDTMYQAVLHFKHRTHKPVISSMQEVAASGAYYVACGSDRIIASPTSVVGSIGVIFETFDVVGTMQKIGLVAEPIKSAELKDMGSPFHHMTPKERDVMQGMVDEYYTRFKSVVTDNRPIKDPQTLALVTDGRVFSGTRAVELGLVDQTGRLEDALDLARQMSGAPDAQAVLYTRPYGYGGSIYASNSTPQPEGNVLIRLPASASLLPGGFYYIWEP